MKKILVLSVAAMTVLAISGQKASAWSQFKFGVGLNLAYRGGGNNFLWGAYKSQQPPAAGYPGYPGVDPAAVPPVMPGAFGAGYGGYGPAFGGGFPGGYGALGGMGYNVGPEAPTPTTPTAQSNTPPNKVQPVDYQSPTYGQNVYPQTGYYMPVSYQTNQAPAPSYWYGR